jgi:hypothetical protein
VPDRHSPLIARPHAPWVPNLVAAEWGLGAKPQIVLSSMLAEIVRADGSHRDIPSAPPPTTVAPPGPSLECASETPPPKSMRFARYQLELEDA